MFPSADPLEHCNQSCSHLEADWLTACSAKHKNHADSERISSPGGRNTLLGGEIFKIKTNLKENYMRNTSLRWNKSNHFILFNFSNVICKKMVFPLQYNQNRKKNTKAIIDDLQNIYIKPIQIHTHTDKLVLQLNIQTHIIA